MSWIYLIVAGLFEVAFTSCMGKVKETTGSEMYWWFTGFIISMSISKNMLILIEIMKPVNHQYISLPVVSLTLPIQEVNATSNNPATIKYIQLITFIFCVQSS